jgi:ribosomal protein S18 acetylase RimI-like enzyme
LGLVWFLGFLQASTHAHALSNLVFVVPFQSNVHTHTHTHIDLSALAALGLLLLLLFDYPAMLLCFFSPSLATLLASQARCDGAVVGVIICRQKRHKSGTMRGYIAMIAVDESYRKRSIGRWPAFQRRLVGV